jgi:transposase
MEAGGFLPPLVLPLDLIKGFSVIIARHTSLKREIDRAFLILELEKANPSQTSKQLKCCKKKAYCWYHRAKEFIEYFENLPPITDGATERLIRSFLKDKERSGAPLIYSPEQQCAIVAMASEKPRKYGIEADKWTHRELAMVANRDGITVAVSCSSVGRILNEADIKPHRSKYWEFPNIDNMNEFNERVAEICAVYSDAEENLKNNIHTVSVDEKTGIQALERINPDKNALPGNIAKLEFEYKRHGTQALIPGFEIGTGKIIANRIGATRTAKDFASLIEDTVNIDPEATWIFVADQLNTHKSEELVKLIAKKLDIKDDLGEKGQKGILRNLESRERFLSDKSHKIRFVYTPKHCSWLNQIEIWFGILTRKILKHGSFQSTDELKERIGNFTEYYNKTMAKVFKWTYKGKLLQA